MDALSLVPVVCSFTQRQQISSYLPYLDEIITEAIEKVYLPQKSVRPRVIIRTNINIKVLRCLVVGSGTSSIKDRWPYFEIINF